MMDDTPFRAAQAAREMQKLAAQHYQGNMQATAYPNQFQPSQNAAQQRALERLAHHQGLPPDVTPQRDRTDEALDTILHAIEGLREAVKQMNAALVEIRRQVSPDVVVVEFPSNALRHSR